MTYKVPNYQTEIDANGNSITSLVQFPQTVPTGASFTATNANKVIICNSPSTPMTLNLYDIQDGDQGRQLYIKNIHPTGTVAVTPVAPQTLDGFASRIVGTTDAIIIIANQADTGWYIFGTSP